MLHMRSNGVTPITNKKGYLNGFGWVCYDNISLNKILFLKYFSKIYPV